MASRLSDLSRVIGKTFKVRVLEGLLSGETFERVESQHLEHEVDSLL